MVLLLRPALSSSNPVFLAAVLFKLRALSLLAIFGAPASAFAATHFGILGLGVALICNVPSSLRPIALENVLLLRWSRRRSPLGRWCGEGLRCNGIRRDDMRELLSEPTTALVDDGALRRLWCPRVILVADFEASWTLVRVLPYGRRVDI